MRENLGDTSRDSREISSFQIANLEEGRSLVVAIDDKRIDDR